MKDFKKIISVFILLSLIFTSCSFGGGDKSEEEKIEKNPIVFSNPTDEKHVKSYLEGDSDLEIAIGGPYYISNKNIDQPFFNEFNKLKQKKVDEIMDITENIFNDSVQLKKELAKYKKSYISLLSEILPENSDLEKFAKDVTKKLVSYQIKEDIFITNYNEIKLDSKNRAINSYLKYNKTFLSLKLADTIGEDLKSFLSMSMQTIVGLDDRELIKKQIQDFDKEMENIVELQDSLINLEKNQILLDTALKQIETANYYMSKGSIAFIKQNLPELKEKVSSLRQRKDIDKEDVDFLENYTNFYDGLSDSLSKSLEENFSKDRLLDVKVTKEDTAYIRSLLPKTFATTNPMEPEGFFSMAFGAMKYGAEKTLNLTKKVTQFSWKTAKATYKGTKKVIGFGAGLADTTAKSGFDIAFGAYDGRSIKEIKKDVFDNFNKFEENVKKGTAGSNLFKNAGKMLDGAEDTIASIPEWGVEKTIGKGRISWGTAGLTKMTVGMFTGLGKGIYKIANAKSTNGEIAEGYLDVGLSFIGGSKVLFKSSKVFSATSKIKGFKEMIKGGFVFIQKGALKLKGQSIKGLSKAAIKKLGLIPGKIKVLVAINPKEEIKQLLKSKIASISNAMKDKLKELSERGLKDIIKSSAGGLDEIKSSYQGFVKEAYEKGLKGYLESILGAVGGSADDYLDNLVGGNIDNLIKTVVKEAVDSGIIPGLEGPFDGKYKATIDEEDFNEYINNFDVIIVGNILSANVKFSKTEDKGTISGDINFDGEIDGSGNLQNGKMQGVVSITIEGKKYNLTIKANLDGTLTENGGTITSSNGKIIDTDGVIGEIVKAIAEGIGEAIGGEGEATTETTTETTVGKELDIDAFHMRLIKEGGEKEVKVDNSGSGTVE